MRRLRIALVASLALGGGAIAQERGPRGMPDGGVFTPFLEGDPSECVSMKAIEKAGAKFMPLKEATFRFVEALYVAIPPMSHDLPPGDKAVLAIGPHGETMAVVVDGDQTCARFMAPNFVLDMIANVESGNKIIATPGKPL